MINRVGGAAVAVLTMALAVGCSGLTAPHRTAAGAPVAAPLKAARSVSVEAAGVPAGIFVASATTAARIPRYSHIVVVVLENHSYQEIIGSRSAPFLSQVARSGAVMTRSYAVTHPSQPNYLALFSGSTHGVSSDSCPQTLTGPNLASALRSHGHSFVGYSESMRAVGFAGCSQGHYVRKHNPWVDFDSLPGSVSQPMNAFPLNPAKLPTVSFVVPNLQHDMHDGTIAQSDAWLRQHLGGYSSWALTHNSLLIVTADEDDRSAGNRIATILSGAHVRPGFYGGRVTHYGILRSVLDSYRITGFGKAATAARLTGMWTS